MNHDVSERLFVISRLLDRGSDPKDPHTWTIDGIPLSPADLALVLTAGEAEWQAVHDLVHLDAQLSGFTMPCCGGKHP